MIEKDVEKKLRIGIARETGGMCLKFVSPGFTGVPDRVILLPGGRIVFAELKAPKKVERPRQVYVQSLIEKLGFKVFSAVDSPEKVAKVVEYCKEVSR